MPTTRIPSASPDDKAQLRALAVAARNALSPLVRTALSRGIAARVDEEVLSKLAPGAVVSLYCAIRSEVDTTAIAEAAVARGLRLAYPLVHGDEPALTFHLTEPRALAVTGPLRIPSPSASAPVIAVEDLAAVIMPGVAFDLHGGRIGWGRGYYDASVAGTCVPRIGIAFDCQVVSRVPMYANDIPVHLVITESRVAVASAVAPELS